MSDAQNYYDGLISQGYSADNATTYTQQHFPDFGGGAAPGPVADAAPVAAVMEDPVAEAAPAAMPMEAAPAAMPMEAAPMAAAGGGHGKVRSPIRTILLSVVSLGFYQMIWHWKVAGENERHAGVGPGGLMHFVQLLIPLWNIVRIVKFHREIGAVQEASGIAKTVSGRTFLWCIIPLAGPFIYIFKVQGGINDAWQARGAPI
jgi:hypothetical protein